MVDRCVPVPFGRGFRVGGAAVNGLWFGLLLVVAGLAVWRAIVEARRCPQANNPFGHNPECPCGGEEPADV